MESQNIRKIFFTNSSQVDVKLYDKTTVHSLANFQAILYFSEVLCKLQNSDFAGIVSMKHWSGLKLFNAIHQMSSSEEVLAKLSENDQERFVAIYSKLEEFASSRLNGKESPRKRKPRKKQDIIKQSNSSPAESDDIENVIENRFSVLSLS